jgi:hypothetical protein
LPAKAPETLMALYRKMFFIPAIDCEPRGEVFSAGRGTTRGDREKLSDRQPDDRLAHTSERT